MSNLFSPDHRRPAVSPLHSPGSRPPSQQGQNLCHWANAHSPEYSLEPGGDAAYGLGPRHQQQQHEQQWLKGGLRPPPIPGSPGRPRPPGRTLTADSRASTDTRLSQPLTRQTGSNLIFPSHSSSSVLGNGSHSPTVSRPSSAHSFVSTHSFAPSNPLRQSNGKSGTSHSGTPSDDRSVERSELHRTLKSIESLLIALDEYRSLQAQLVKVEKRLGLSSMELAKNKTIEHNPSSALELAATNFTAQHDVGTRFVKLVHKEYDALNHACARYFKMIAKEEKALDDFAAVTEDKIKKAQFAYEKAARKGSGNPRAIAEAHEKYIGTISALANETNAARQAHGSAMATKSHGISLRVASILGGIADSSFRFRCDAVRAAGHTIGPLAAALNFCVGEAMPMTQPMPLNEGEAGLGTQIASVEASLLDYDEGANRDVAGAGDQDQLRNGRDEAEKADACGNAFLDLGLSRIEDANHVRPQSQLRNEPTLASQSAVKWPSNRPLVQKERGKESLPEHQVSYAPTKPEAIIRSHSASQTSSSAATTLSPRTPDAEQEHRDGHVQQGPSRIPPPPLNKPAVVESSTLSRQTLPLNIERRTSVTMWQRKREEEERREREANLERRAREAEGRLRLLESAIGREIGDEGGSRLPQRRDEEEQERDCNPPQREQRQAFSSSLSTGSPRDVDHHLQDYFAHGTPTSHHTYNGGAESSGLGGASDLVSRTLSSATDASERSFVARMRSRYQMEKGQGRDAAIRKGTDRMPLGRDSSSTLPQQGGTGAAVGGRDGEGDTPSDLSRPRPKTRTTDTALTSMGNCVSTTAVHSPSTKPHSEMRPQAGADVRRRSYQPAALADGGRRGDDERHG